ncbi:hypothetical protein T265_01007 [Opisthorchis viverrini]|uniref:DUF4201 domain-containing protein n=1 Tax=Opisthorchis viverrini TaxID=6198 RepID=A0A075A4B4_OPIVI|nr:hypothetical protein T265_01007 [Opisthorchis viverrini]KER33117.1 hypothetical protein T265_01007 [Opisthorchis viverrini]
MTSRRSLRAVICTVPSKWSQTSHGSANTVTITELLETKRNCEAPDHILLRQQETSDLLTQRHNLRFRSSCTVDKYRRLDARIKCSIINAEREAVITEMQEACRKNEASLSAYKNNLICSLQMNNALLRASMRRTKAEIFRTAKEEKPTKLDFSLAQKDNTAFSERLEELSSTINRTKCIHSKLRFQYRTVKDNLLRQISEKAQLQRKISQKQAIMASVVEAVKKLNTNLREEKLHHQHRQSMRNIYAAPSVNDCIQQIKLSQSIDREIKLCEQRERLSQLIYQQKLNVLTKLCCSMSRKGAP